jgi:hypothetical protein
MADFLYKAFVGQNLMDTDMASNDQKRKSRSLERHRVTILHHSKKKCGKVQQNFHLQNKGLGNLPHG